jgi:hypothetical protein
LAQTTPGDWQRDAGIQYNSYAGTDIVAQIVLPGEAPLIVGELQTISYSIHRENTPVRTLGHVNPIGFVKGPRTIAGSLIFTVFDEYTFYRIGQYKRAVQEGFFPLSDMLPPFDVAITFSNEYGVASTMKLFGISVIDEGQTMSVDDLITEQTYTYMARGIQPIKRYSNDSMIPSNTPTSNNDETARFN